MKRYIKVKKDDGEIVIYDTNDYSDGFNFYTSKNALFYGDSNISYLGDIVKDSDKLEELCDIFIEEFPIYKGNNVVGIDHQIWLFNKERNRFENGFDEYSHKHFIDNKYNFYGAIWTNKGLVYVAKLNNKGELELL